MECISDVWVNYFNQVGLPVALLVMLFYSVYRAIKWLAPKIDVWVNNYFAIQEQRSKIFQESSEKCLTTQVQILNAIEKLTDSAQFKQR